MGSIIPVVLFGLAGILVGGVISLRKNGAPPLPLVVVSLLALIAAGGGVLWLLPKG